MSDRDRDPSVTDRWDHLADELRRRRQAAGEPSFAEIAERVSRARIDAGSPPARARVARSTVHAAFATGRSRIDASLVREIAAALGGPALPPTVLTPRSVSPSPATPAVVDHPVAPPTDLAPSPGPSRRRRTSVVVIVACLALNLAGRGFVDVLGLPIYLDMLGTAVAAIALGPWRGAAVGLGTNVLGALGSGPVSIPFAVVNVAGALVWALGVRRLAMGRSLPRFFALNVVVALVCSALAVPVLLLLNGVPRRGGDHLIVEVLQRTTGDQTSALVLANLLTSGADKIISGFIAAVVIAALPAAVARPDTLGFLRVPPSPGSLEDGPVQVRPGTL